jgi:hypothetical protein
MTRILQFAFTEFDENLDEESHVITEDTNNWTPTNWGSSYIHLIDASSDYAFSGFAALPNGTRRLLYNGGDKKLQFRHESALSGQLNRLILPKEQTLDLEKRAVLIFQYVESFGRWLLVSKTD